MSMQRYLALAVVLILSGAAVLPGLAQDTPAELVDPSIAQLSPDQLVKLRQDAMKADGGVLKGAADLQGDAMVEAARLLLKNFVNFPAMFPAGSIVGESDASPIIFEKRADFDALFAKGAMASEAALVAAKAGDHDGFLAALAPFGGREGLCGQCHQNYRQPRD